MCYRYEDFKPRIFSEEIQGTFLRIRDRVGVLLEEAGAVSMQKLLNVPGVLGDTWLMMACVDRLIELGEIREVKRTPAVMAKYRIFVRPGE